MRTLLDTNVLVAAVVENHVFHERSLEVVQRVHNRKDAGVVSGHSMAEMYAILTRLPAPFRHTPEQAWLSIEENVVKHFKVAGLTGDDYCTLVHDAALAGIQGGTVYDAVLLKCALRETVDRIYTLNLKHFLTVAPKEMVSKIFEP